MKIISFFQQLRQNKYIKMIEGTFSEYLNSEKIMFIVFNLYYFCVLFDTTTLVLDIPYFSWVLKLIRYMTYLYMIIFILNQIVRNFFTLYYEQLNQFIMYGLIALFFGLLFINAMVTDNKTMFLSMIMVLGFSSVKRRKLYQWFFQNQIISIALVTTAAVLGLTEDFLSWRDEIVRHALGFDYATNLPQILMFAILYKIFFDRFNVSKLQLLIFQIGIVFVYYLTDSRTEFLVSELIVLSVILSPLVKFEIFKRLLLFFEKLFVFGFPMYPMMSGLLTYLYGMFANNKASSIGKVMLTLNEGLSNRLHQTWMNFFEDGMSFYGSGKPLIGYSAAEFQKYGEIPYSNFIDNDYMNILFTKGLIIFIMIMFFIYLTLIFLYQRQQHLDLFVCFIILTFALINPRIFSFEYSIFGIIMFYSILNYYCESQFPLIAVFNK